MKDDFLGEILLNISFPSLWQKPIIVGFADPIAIGWWEVDHITERDALSEVESKLQDDVEVRPLRRVEMH